MTLSVETDTDRIEIIEDDDESIVTIERDDYGIVVLSEVEITDGATGESVTREAPVAYIAYSRRKLRNPEKFYEAVEEELSRNVHRNCDSTLHSVWSTSREAVKQLRKQEEGDTA